MSIRCLRPSRRSGMMIGVISQHDHADRQVHEEDPPPVERGDKQPAQRRPGDGGHAGHRAPDAERGTAPFRRERVRDDRQGLRHEHGGAEPLDRAERDQPARARGQAAGGRGGREHRDAAGEHDPWPDQVTKPACRDDQDRENQGVGVDHPQHVIERGVQVGDQVRDRDVDDGQVEQGHEEPERDDDQHCPGVPVELPHDFSLLHAHRLPSCAPCRGHVSWLAGMPALRGGPILSAG